jgi:hypothetical protein
MRYSVTVSIGDDAKGILNFNFFVKLVVIFTSLGSMFEYAGSKSTSSKVNASRMESNLPSISVTVCPSQEILSATIA